MLKKHETTKEIGIILFSILCMVVALQPLF